LKVDLKVNPHDRRAVLEKLRRNRAVPEIWRKRELEATYRYSHQSCRTMIDDKLINSLIYASAPLGGVNAYMFYRCFLVCVFFLFFFRPPQRSA